jgi:hypothetical protein
MMLIFAVAWTVNTAGATVINFDDLGPVIGVPDGGMGSNSGGGPLGMGEIPANYAGFTWTTFAAVHKDFFLTNYGVTGTGYEFGTVSGSYSTFNNWAEVASVDAKPFVFRSAYLTAAEYEVLPVTVTAFRNGVQMYSTTVDTRMTTPAMFAFPSVKVDRVSFTPGLDGGVFVMDDFTYSTIPVVDAGVNVQVASENQDSIIILGKASDEDGEPLLYRWLEGTTVISGWLPVGLNGEANLDLGPAVNLAFGEHTLTLQVKPVAVEIVESDEMILTIANSAPHAVATGSGTFEFAAPVTLGGEVSDFDGDSLTYQWTDGSAVLFSGSVATTVGGAAALLPAHAISTLAAGTHTLTLTVIDGINAAVTKEVTVVVNPAVVIDTTPPKLSPKADKSILWPPNHQMVPVTIMANAVDNSGGPVTLSVTVKSNEARSKKEQHEPDVDWTTPVIDQATGKITLKLRAEKNHKGDGRVYTITITATDQAGNTSKSTVKISVSKASAKEKDCDDKWEYWHNQHKSRWEEPGYKEWFDDFYSDWFEKNHK